jgi:ribose 5-phosphate isomerase A
VIVVDSGKRVERLGQQFALPVEVVPFAWKVVKADLAELGGQPRLRMRGDEPYRTDNGNHILDTKFSSIDDPAGLDRLIRDIPGVVENGLFVGMVDLLVVGGPDGVETLAPCD